LIDASCDTIGIDGRVQFVDSPEIGAPYLSMDRLARKFLNLPVTENGQFTIVDCQLKAGFVDPGHFRVNRIAFVSGFHIRQRGHVLDRLLILPSKNCGLDLLLVRDVHILCEIDDFAEVV